MHSTEKKKVFENGSLTLSDLCNSVNSPFVQIVACPAAKCELAIRIDLLDQPFAVSFNPLEDFKISPNWTSSNPKVV